MLFIETSLILVYIDLNKQFIIKIIDILCFVSDVQFYKRQMYNNIEKEQRDLRLFVSHKITIQLETYPD